MNKPPVPQAVPYVYTRHGISVEDPYAWLKDPGYPEVSDPKILAYLRAENDYFESQMGPYRPLVDDLFEELKAREPEEDAGVPYRKGRFWYQWRFAHGAQYRTWLRAPLTQPHSPPPSDHAAWKVFLDEPLLAKEHNYFVLGGFSISRNDRYLAWTADVNGSERFTLYVKDMETGELLAEPISDTTGAPVWVADNSRFFYVIVNEQWRPYQVRLHQLGKPRSAEHVVYEENDESFFVDVDETTSEDFILISAGDHVTSEIRYLPADDPTAELSLFAPRRTGHEYSVDHGEGFFYFMSNASHKNFALLRAPQATPEEACWEPLLTGTDEQYLKWFSRFRGRLVIGERIAGLEQVKVLDDGGDDYLIDFPEATHSVGPGTNAEYDATALRVHYQSMVTPGTVFDFHFADGRLEQLKQQRIPTGYDGSRYATDRLTAIARDGTRVPVSIVYRRNLPRDGSAPLYLYAYGAYGIATMPGFSANRL
ncbi:MAG: hypothetical protein ACNA7W_13835, partial [Pseudomonadales bacterium]